MRFAWGVFSAQKLTEMPFGADFSEVKVLFFLHTSLRTQGTFNTLSSADETLPELSADCVGAWSHMSALLIRSQGPAGSLFLTAGGPMITEPM